MRKIRLCEVAGIAISNVDKKTHPNQKKVRLCNYVDVYHNWAITSDMMNSLMEATANENELKRFRLQCGDIALTKDSETKDDIGKAAYIADNFDDVVLGYHCALIRPDKELLDGKYLNALLHTNYACKYFELSAGGSGQRFYLGVDALNNFPIMLPSMEIQRKIGNFFSTIDKKIELNKRINDNLSQQINTLYNYWFVQFDFPDIDSKPYCSSGNTMMYNEFIGMNIPKDWTVASIACNPLTSIINSGVDFFSTKTYYATGAINGTTISEGKEIEYKTRESRANMQPKLYSVWFAKMKNSVKHLYLNSSMESITQNSILSTGFCGLQCDNQDFEYVASYIEYSYFENKKNSLAHGATQEAVNLSDLDLIPIVIPPKEIIVKFHELTESMYSQIGNNICENQELSRMREWLLPILMNNQITIMD